MNDDLICVMVKPATATAMSALADDMGFAPHIYEIRDACKAALEERAKSPTPVDQGRWEITGHDAEGGWLIQFVGSHSERRELHEDAVARVEELNSPTQENPSLDQGALRKAVEDAYNVLDKPDGPGYVDMAHSILEAALDADDAQWETPDGVPTPATAAAIEAARPHAIKNPTPEMLGPRQSPDPDQQGAADLEAMTAARDLCKQQATEAGEKWILAKTAAESWEGWARRFKDELESLRGEVKAFLAATPIDPKWPRYDELKKRVSGSIGDALFPAATSQGQSGAAGRYEIGQKIQVRGRHGGYYTPTLNEREAEIATATFEQGARQTNQQVFDSAHGIGYAKGLDDGAAGQSVSDGAAGPFEADGLGLTVNGEPVHTPPGGYRFQWGAAAFARWLNEWLAANPTVSDGWQDIESAPKDGTDIQVIDTEHGQFVVSWSGDDWLDWTGTNLVDLTHWMPLPKPPAATTNPTQGPEAA